MAAWIEDGGGERIRTGAHFDGKIDRPRVFAGALPADRVMALADARLPAVLETRLVAAWDFSADIMSDRVTDRAPNGLHGTAVNLPARGVTGFNWTGDTWSWRHAPDQYGAIHFHADDLYDAGWETDFSLTVPPDMRSGIYAARLGAKDAEFYVPFYLRPPTGRRTAEVLFLVPTATYMAYANNRGRVTSPVTDALIGKLTVVDEIDLLMLDRPEIGLSTYDPHGDGSSVCYSSRLRPITNHRPKDSDISVAYNNFAADLLIVDWFAHRQVPFDVITDEGLHHEGAAALEGYRVLVTGTHPEYFSREMLDALEAHTDKGGRLMYLGGNGFYWRVAFRADKPGVVELRRAQLNIGRWNPGPGQYFHSFSGEHGGLWRDLGRPSQGLVGVGFISQGFDSSSYYRRTADARNPRVAFMFDGVEDGIIGDFGLIRGGAAGIEIDRHDERLGSPRHALVVASSENHTNVYEPFEEVLPTEPSPPDTRPAIRSDMVFFECPNGGAVFSVGSIAFAGALSHNDNRNNISRLTANVLRRFLDPTPFEMPAGG
jgi:N,N-dimethylformamidase